MSSTKRGDDRHAADYYITPQWAIRNFLLAWPVATSITTVDWREDSRAEHKADFLMWQPPNKFDMAITNPPFAIAQEVIDRCFQVVHPGGLVVMLLRLNFFGGAKRFDWWQRTMPVACYVHSKRIGFTEDGKTDSIEYCHCVWAVGETPRFTVMRVI